MIMIPFAEDGGRKPNLEHQRTLIAAPFRDEMLRTALPHCQTFTPVCIDAVTHISPVTLAAGTSG
jgi:hypothetical protein